MGTVFTACTLVPLAIVAIQGRMTESYTRQSKELEGEQGQVAQEHLSGVHTVKSFGMEEKSKQLYDDAAVATYDLKLKIALLEVRLSTGLCEHVLN
jgi:ABC-type multidrug transport system fused ATPase/permease subunit